MLELHLIAIKDDLGKMIGLAFREMLSLAQKLTRVYFFKSWNTLWNKLIIIWYAWTKGNLMYWTCFLDVNKGANPAEEQFIR